MRSLWRDIRLGLRSLLRRPGFTVAAVLLLALGIGSNTAIFTLLDAVFLHPIPVAHPETLLSIYRTERGENGEYSGFDNFSYPASKDLRERSRSLAGFAIYQWSAMNLTGGDEPSRVTGMFVSGNYFDVLGLRPQSGRLLQPADELPGAPAAAVVSHGCWGRLFGFDRGLIGRRVTVNGEPFTVVGVAPAGFRGNELHINVDVWVPVTAYPRISAYPQFFDNREVAIFRAFGRLRPGVTQQQAEGELAEVARQLVREYPRELDGLGITTTPFVQSAILPRERGRFEGYGRTLAIAVVLILLVACINVANLLTVRGLEREREIALCLALGASRAQMMRRLLVETLLLFLLGGLLSLPVGRLSLALLWHFRPPEFMQANLDFGLDAPVLAFALGVTLAASLIFGLVPALRASRPDLMSVLRDAMAAAPRPHNGWQPRRLLVAGQLALALVALLGAGLFVRSLRGAQRIELGFRPDHLVVVTVSPGDQGYSEPVTRQYYQRLLDHLGSVPGVLSATLSENRLLRGGVLKIQVFLPRRDAPVVSPEGTEHRSNAVVPGFFRTAGIPLIAGRDFGESDCATCPPVIIINRTMAETLWPGESAVGKRIHLSAGDSNPFEVVGVAENARYRYLQEPSQFFLYLPVAQRFSSAMTLHVRTAGDPEEMIPVLRKEVQQLDPNLPLAELDSMDNFVAGALWMERMSASLLGMFGLLALLLAVVGVYGMMAYSVAQRRREIGLRLALGARRSQVLWGVLGEAAAVTAVGVLLGWGLTYFVLAPVVASQLHGVSPTDPLSYAVQTLLLAAAAILSSWVPARRAAATSPAVSLRGD
jgi:macrolide transport system ATP-binding/permease protein